MAGYKVTALVKANKKEFRDDICFIGMAPCHSRLRRFARLPAIFFRALKIKADVYHLHNPDMIPVAFLLKLLGKKVVYDTHEDFSQRLLMRAWIPRLIRPALCSQITKSERLLSHLADATLVTQDHQLADFSNKTYLIRNAPHVTREIYSQVESYEENIVHDDGAFRLIYAGQITRPRGLFVMLDAMETLKQKGLSTRLWLLGEFKLPLRIEAQQHPAWELVDYLGVQRQEKVFAYMKSANLGLALLSDIGDHKTAYPNKVLEYAYWHLPFIASNFRLWQSMFANSVGIWIEPDNPDSLALQIEKLVTNPKSYQALKESFSDTKPTVEWKRESQKLITLYEQLLGNP
jgi:glycosyltransferase involved in cell wall biosynthesis